MNHEEIRKEMKNGKTLNEICEEHNVSLQDLFKALKKGNPGRSKNKMKHIHEQGNRYIIARHVGKGLVYYGSFESAEEAIQTRNRLIANDWNTTNIDCHGDMYIRGKGREYYILKSFKNRKNIRVLGLKTKEEARKVRDICMDCNWDMTLVRKKREELGI